MTTKLIHVAKCSVTPAARAESPEVHLTLAAAEVGTEPSRCGVRWRV
jgi:hypothetical protein